jgi:hypothetical protein
MQGKQNDRPSLPLLKQLYINDFKDKNIMMTGFPSTVCLVCRLVGPATTQPAALDATRVST